MTRPPTKSTYKIAKAKEKGRLRAQLDQNYAKIPSFFKMFFSGRGKRERAVSAWQWLTHAIPNPAQLAAIIFLTVIVKGIISTTESYGRRVQAYFEAGMTIPFLLGTPLASAITPFLWPAETPKKSWTEELFTWGISFSIAWLIIKHGGQIIGLLGDVKGGLTQIVGFLLA